VGYKVDQIMPTAKSINHISAPRRLLITKAELDKPLVDRSAIECRPAFTEIKTAIEELRAGRMIIVVDDEDRENEGDLTMAAEKVTPEAITFMASYGRGLICLAMTGQRLDELELGPMAPNNTARTGTAFTVSIDALGWGVTTGISSHDRAQTIRASIDSRTWPQHLGRPGHIFPLRARAGGVLERPGHTEASVDLARLAGLHPSGVICEIMKDDGSMAHIPDLIQFSTEHHLKMITVAELIRYRLEQGNPSAPERGIRLPTQPQPSF
jgi:3,4-dihydroxy 2-butanone 4-phosphate synthase / GTP cyclohydrolase II